jgi:hypothetical protein
LIYRTEINRAMRNFTRFRAAGQIALGSNNTVKWWGLPGAPNAPGGGRVGAVEIDKTLIIH